MNKPEMLWRGSFAVIAQHCFEKTPKVPRERADTTNNWTGSGRVLGQWRTA